MKRHQHHTINQRRAWDNLNKVLAALREHGSMTTPELIKAAGLAKCFDSGRVFLYNEMLADTNSSERLVAAKGARGRVTWSIRTVTPKEKP